MEVILLERIERLGHMGQVVKVRPGFARNFLLPQNKALRATKANLELFEKQRAELEARNAAERSKAEALAGKLDSLKLVIIRQASESGHLFGSVSARDVSDAAVAAGHKLDRTQVQIDAPIKTLGLFQVKVKLHPEVIIKVTVNVARTQEEALVQAQKGTVVTAEPAEETAAAPTAEAAPAAETAAEGEEAPKAKKPRAKKAS
ncbi:MAG: 50S ribosomal protein L9 [Alphaproteobacteria bacterium]|nr:50S ribosomal protein L9 [Alphaproteobacteria bacterium]MBV8548134.1 50S ribosomal protein L9 [Alphaproteobacteria bacterium]